MNPPRPETEIRVWDPLVRLFHWSLVVAFAIAYFTQEREYELHRISGYIVLGLVGFRVIWGVVGPKHARFSDFLYPPSSTLRYLAGLPGGRSRRYLGHNPAGGMMVVAMLLSLAALTLSGIALDAAENRTGPLTGMRLFLYAGIIADLHEFFTDLMLLLIPLHLLGIYLSSRAHRENLVVAMVTGRKRALEKRDDEPNR